MLCIDPSGALAGGALPPIAPAPQLVNAQRELQLNIIINGEDTRLIEPFRFDPFANKLSAKRKDLEEAGIKTPATIKPDEDVSIDALGATYRYDESAQKILFTLSDEQRLPRIYDAQPGHERPKPHADLGALLNYSVFGGLVRDATTGKVQYNNVNALLDARLFSDYGALTQSGIVGKSFYSGKPFLRLDSTYTYSSLDYNATARVGDFISGGPAWSRQIHMGGAQVARDFSLRPDFATQPLPQFSGSAATPSTVDVLVNGNKVYSQDIGSGPYSITNLPVFDAGGDARVVVRDATGKAVETHFALFNPERLLAVGLSDYSFEAGLARRSYGLVSNDYLRTPVGSATYRYGLSNWLTVESHGEGGAGLINGGFGAIASLGAFGTSNVALSGSHSRHGNGGQIYADWQGQWRQFTLSLGTQRTFGGYDDLASVTANTTVDPALIGSTNFVSPRPPKALDRIAFGMPVYDEHSTFSLGAINLVQQDKTVSRLITASLSRSLPWRQATFFATAFSQTGSTKNYGVFAGVSFVLSDGVYASAGANYDKARGASAAADISKSQLAVDDTYGYRVRAGLGGGAFGQVDGSYRSSLGQAAASVTQNSAGTTATGEFEGSIAMLGGGVFAGNKVDSGFAVVDAGAPGVTVTQDNRAIGKTGWTGKYLVPNLRPYDANIVGIDPQTLPPSFEAGKTTEVVAPRGNAGVAVTFGAQSNADAAIVVFVDAAGKPLAAGLKGHLDGQEASFLVGHDGRAYVRALSQANAATIDLGAASCRAEFAFTPNPGYQTVVRGVLCQ